MSRNVRAIILAPILCILIWGAGVVSAAESTPYRLGAEDIITVTVLNHPEFSGEYGIPANGVLNLPVAGEVKAIGCTVTDLTTMIADRMKSRLKSPEVTVSLKAPRARRISVLGAVGKPGNYDIKDGWRVTEALSAAGGITSGIEAADCTVVIVRGQGGDRKSIPLSDALRQDSESNVAVCEGDVITIDAGEMIPVYVMGRVKMPGVYRIKKDTAGVLEALAIAGGTMEDAAIGSVTITHLSGVRETIDLIPAIRDGKQIPTSKLQSGDLVLVPETNLRIAVLGFVGQPGVYDMKDGQKLTLSEVIGLAKGMDNKRAKLESVAVMRTVDGKQEKRVYNLAKFLKSGDMAQNPFVSPGDVVYVPETGKFDWDLILRAMSATGVLMNAVN